MTSTNISKKNPNFNCKNIVNNIGNIIIYVFLIIGSIVMFVPIVWMITTSFDWKAVLEVPFPPKFYPQEFSIKPYIIAFKNIPMLKYMLNSLSISIGVVFINCTSALLAGYALSKIKFKGSNIILIFALSTIMIPFEMTMIPQYLLFSKLGLINSYMAFYLPAISYVFGTFLSKQYIDTLPDSLREAAKIDGAFEFRIFFRIFAPLCGPIISTLVILGFLWTWNDFLWPLIVLNDINKYTIQIGVALFTYNQGINQMPAIRMASSVVTIIPVLIIYIFLQRYIIESIALTGIKQ